ncbi:MAG: Flp pilus assembly protein CpaB [Candidatus Melainabacteria bacterium GWF2_37_15]|nr:MAG: Flp pilus assembly protein CpaB [Candidatus Melainabacteria bacterium GWF2_37_15]
MRLNKKNKKKVIIAVILGAVATIGIFNSMNSKQAALNDLNKKIQQQNAAISQLKKNPDGTDSKTKKISAVVAIQDIKVGDTFTVEMLKNQECKEEELPEGYFNNTSLIVGKKSGKNIVKGQFITSAEIQAEYINTIEIPNDMRAISIPVEKFKGLASHIRVGSSVDILKLSTPPEYIAQNVRIVAFEASGGTTASRYNADSAGGKVNLEYLTATQASAITFLVPIDLVSRIVDNMVGGELQIITRNASDEKVIIAERELPPPPSSETPTLELPPPNIPEEPSEEVGFTPPKLPPPEPKKIELIKASAISTIEFGETEQAETNPQEDAAPSEDLNKLKELLDLAQ